MSTLPPCPKCNSEYTYEDGEMYVCPECAHEWSKNAPAAAAEEVKVWRDANGNVIHSGNTEGERTIEEDVTRDLTYALSQAVAGSTSNAVGGRAIVLGHGLHTRLNPLDEGHRPSGLSDEQWASTVASRRRDLIGALAETVLARGLTPLEHTAIDLALTATVRENDVPILPMVVDRILAPSADADGRLAEDGRLVGHALRRLVAGDLAGLFDGPSTVAFDPSLPMISLDLSRVTENSTLISVLMTCSSAWMESALLDPNGGQRWVIYDEAWRLMSHPALLRRMDAHWRLARHYGIANMLIFHKLTDLDNVGDQGSAMRSLANSLLAKAETRVIYRQESDQLGPTAKALGLTGTEQKLLPTLGVGQGLWKIKSRSFISQHQLHPVELELFRTDARYLGGQS